MLDLKETEAVELLAALAKRYRIAGRTTVDLFEILATIASHAVIGMSNILHLDDPEHPDCPLCRACGHVDALAHGVRDDAGATESTEEPGDIIKKGDNFLIMK
jgi:hypothetical protein